MSNTQFSTREVPWTKLGTVIDKPVSAAEAAKLGGLDFNVRLEEVGWKQPGFTGYKEIAGQRAVVREDTGDFFGFVSSGKYHPLQYSEAFAFMDEVGSRYVAAGALRGGRQGFIVVEAPDEAQVNILGGEDAHKMYAVVRTSHDRSRGVEVMAHPLRGMCMNMLTLSSFSKHAPIRWSIKHTSSMQGRLAEAQKSLKQLGIYARRYEDIAHKMIVKKITSADVEKVLKILIPKPAGTSDRVIANWAIKSNWIQDQTFNGPNVGYTGTAWGFVNAVSEYMDWERDGGTPESRFIGALQGQTHTMINRAAGLMLAVA